MRWVDSGDRRTQADKPEYEYEAKNDADRLPGYRTGSRGVVVLIARGHSLVAARLRRMGLLVKLVFRG